MVAPMALGGDNCRAVLVLELAMTTACSVFTSLDGFAGTRDGSTTGVVPSDAAAEESSPVTENDATAGGDASDGASANDCGSTSAAYGTVSGTLGAPPWADSDGALAPGGEAATITITGGAGFLTVTGFGFALPSNATVTGITVGLARRAAAGAVFDATARLVLDGSLLGRDRNFGPPPWDDAFTLVKYGGATDTWDAALSGGDVNKASFGVGVTPKGLPNAIVEVDAISLEVAYCTPVVR